VLGRLAGVFAVRNATATYAPKNYDYSNWQKASNLIFLPHQADKEGHQMSLGT